MNPTRRTEITQIGRDVNSSLTFAFSRAQLDIVYRSRISHSCVRLPPLSCVVQIRNFEEQTELSWLDVERCALPLRSSQKPHVEQTFPVGLWKDNKNINVLKTR